MKYGLIAEKIAHSFSAEIHKKLFGYDYELKALARDELDSFMKLRDFTAINVTIPYKESVIPYLDCISETAREIGAVNTIVNRDGRLYGFNTDAGGLTALIAKNSIEIKDKKVLILGSGGTSKTALYVAKSLGAKEIFRVSRSGNDGCITYQTAREFHNDAEVIINTTPCGMFPNIGASPVEICDFKSLQAVVDVVYNPLRTKLVCDAKGLGIKAVGGLYMLVAQAALAAEKFVNKSATDAQIDEVYQSIFNSKQNIVLIGMPSCGKSASGKILAEELGVEFIDTDEEIHKKHGKYAHEIINESGENSFRDIESEVVKEVSSLQGKVISTGGGAILRKENVELLRENGRLYFLDRALDELRVGSNRPLSSTRDLLEQRYNERYPIYCSVCDKIIKCVDGAALNANQILEDLKQ